MDETHAFSYNGIILATNITQHILCKFKIISVYSNATDPYIILKDIQYNCLIKMNEILNIYLLIHFHIAFLSKITKAILQ